MASKIDVFLITGFLGSGKTTFLKRVIDSFPKDRKLMILMNEFGEVGIDGALVQEEGLEILEISKGSIFCVCVKTDFIKGLYRIAFKMDVNCVVIETTGVANPKQLSQDLALPIFQDRFFLAGQYCIVDAVNFEDAYQVYASLEKQIESASVFIINKTDLASPEQIRRIEELILSHRPDAVFHETSYADVPVGLLIPERTPGDETPLTFSPRPFSEEELDGAIDRILFQPGVELFPPDRLVSGVYLWTGSPKVSGFPAERLPRTVLRAKGFLGNEHETYLFDWAMGKWRLEQFHLPENRTELVNSIVVIGPPEMIADLEAFSVEFPEFRPKSFHDPMKSIDL
jgi:G3E family GTPase